MNKLLEKEIYKNIIDYENKYQISNLGNVKSLNYKRSNISKLLNYKKDGNFYPSVLLCKNNKTKRFLIHRLIATYFIPNPLNLPCINHIDGNKLNYNLNNLEWCTHSENTKHAFKIGLMSNPKKGNIKSQQKIIDITTNIVYDTIKEVAIKFNLKYSTLTQKLNGTHKNNTNFKYYDKNK